MWMAGGGIKARLPLWRDRRAYPAPRSTARCTCTTCTPRCCNQLGLDHTKLTYPYGGRNFRLTEVYGNVIKPIIA